MSETPQKPFDYTDFIIRLEGGEIQDELEIIEGLTNLRDSGILFQLQGFYGRLAHRLGVI